MRFFRATIPGFSTLALLVLLTSPVQAQRIVLVGDSTVASYPNPPSDRPDLAGWGQVLGEYFLEPVVLVNHARSGASSKSFIREGLWKRALAEKPTHILIQFGHNDGPVRNDRSTSPASDYQDYLKQYISEARAAGAKPLLVTPVARRTYKEGKLFSLLQPYVSAMKKVGQETQTPVIDLHADSFALLDRLGDSASLDLGPSASDRSHFSAKGARVMARLVTAQLPEHAPELARHLKFPTELVEFVPYREQPIFSPVPGAWDAKIRERGWILREDGLYKLWYTGYDGTREGLRMLGYATSPDGIQWTRHPKNPLLRTEWVEDMMVHKHEGKYYMFAEGKNDRAHLLTSKNGISWTETGKLDIRLRNGKPLADGPYGTPTAWRENERWYLFYERNDLGVWLATSTDLTVWTNVQDEPVLRPGPGDYDRDLIALNQILKHQGRYYAYYHGCARAGPNARLWSTNIARSRDLIHWEKYPGNPLLPVRDNKSSGILVHDGQNYRLYTMHPEVYLHLPKEVRRNAERDKK